VSFSKGMSGNACYNSVENLPVCYPKTYSSEYTELKFCRFFLYEYDTWSLKLREEHRLRVFVNKVLKIAFEPKRDEVTGG